MIFVAGHAFGDNDLEFEILNNVDPQILFDDKR
jgi:hypothetical protein